MQVSADLSSKIAFLSRFEKTQLKQVRFSLILYDDQIGQHRSYWSTAEDNILACYRFGQYQ